MATGETSTEILEYFRPFFGCRYLSHLAYNVEAAWRSGGLIVHPFISVLMIIKCTKVWLWYTAAILPNCLL